MFAAFQAKHRKNKTHELQAKKIIRENRERRDITTATKTLT